MTVMLRGRAARDLAKRLGIKLGGNKMGAKRSRCAAGHYHPSKGEAAYCNHLHLRQRAREIKDLEVNPTIPLWKGRRYKADFRYIETPFNRLVVEEFKGFETRDWVLVRKAWPEYGRGFLRQTHQKPGGGFFVKREIAGRWAR
ncbi:MAG: hypothetical protein ACREH5_09060 [Candidatus Omnitrophota bacterium]